MAESNKPNATTKDKLMADMKQMVADAEALLQATSDQASERVAGLRTRLQESLKAAPGQFAKFETMLFDKTTEAIRETLQKTSDAANQAAESARDAAKKAEESVKKATDSGIETAQKAAESARDAAQKAAVATSEAAIKALDAMTELARKGLKPHE